MVFASGREVLQCVARDSQPVRPSACSCRSCSCLHHPPASSLPLPFIIPLPLPSLFPPPRVQQRIVYVDKPELGYVKGNQEIPAGAAFELDIEVLSTVTAVPGSSS